MRPSWIRAAFLTLAIALPRPAAAQIRAEVFASGFQNPVAFVQDPTAAAVFFVVEQGGRIRTIRNRTIEPVDFLDLRGNVSAGGERGLLGLALAPDYAQSGRVFVDRKSVV